ncbi:MAG: hypothetical protein NDJ72_05215 [Elusimicrobia bacterium]|nr:hypothetical protein [Elusimicrobiota bacterium]
MSRLSQVLTVLATTFGLRAGAAQKPPRDPDPIQEPTSFPRPAGTGHRYGPRITEGGNPPDNWGRSAACARMVRQNRRREAQRARYESPRKGGRACTRK